MAIVAPRIANEPLNMKSEILIIKATIGGWSKNPQSNSWLKRQ